MSIYNATMAASSNKTVEPFTPSIKQSVNLTGTTYAYQGCYLDGTASHQALSAFTYSDDVGMTVESCLSNCNAQKYTYGGLEMSTQCVSEKHFDQGVASNKLILVVLRQFPKLRYRCGRRTVRLSMLRRRHRILRRNGQALSILYSDSECCCRERDVWRHDCDNEARGQNFCSRNRRRCSKGCEGFGGFADIILRSMIQQLQK